MTTELEDVLAVARETLQDSGLAAGMAILDAKGYDSLTHIRFVLALQQRYGITIAENELTETSTAIDVSDLVRRKRG
jgi:acyl carrier protein